MAGAASPATIVAKARISPIAVAALGIALMNGMDAATKSVAMSIGVYNTMLWAALAAQLIVGAIWLTAGRPWPGRDAMRVHLLRGAVSTATAFTWMWGITRLPLAEAIALSFIAPLIVLYLAAAMLGERIGRAAVAGSLLGFAGVFVIVAAQIGAPYSAEGLAGVAAVLTSAVLYAVNIVLRRRQALVAGPVEIALFQNMVVLGLLACVAPLLAVVPAASHAPSLVIAATLAVAATLLLAWAYRRAEAQTLAPVEYSAIIWSALLGAIVFGERLSAATVVGAALIIGGCLVAARLAAPAEAAA